MDSNKDYIGIILDNFKCSKTLYNYQDLNRTDLIVNYNVVGCTGEKN